MRDESSFTELHQTLIDRYDLEELRTLCAQLGVGFDDLRGEGRQAKARELILWLQRRGRLDELEANLQSIRRARPNTKGRAGVSSAIYSRLRETLLDCGPFGDDNQLKAVFAHPKLKPWRHSVPQAPNPAARADAVIALLIDKRRSDTKENALVLLLHVLSGRLDPGEECHSRLAKLADDLEQALGGGSRADQSTVSTQPTSDQSPALDAEITAEIERLVREDHLAEALEELSSLEDYRHDATLLARQLKRIREQERRGTVTRDEANAERTRIAEAILDLISS